MWYYVLYNPSSEEAHSLWGLLVRLPNLLNKLQDNERICLKIQGG